MTLGLSKTVHKIAQRMTSTQQESQAQEQPQQLPKTYKRAAFKEKGAPLTVEDVELKLPGPGQVLVKVEACGVCHSDMFAQQNIMGGGFPLVPGHEIIGRIAAVGPDEKEWKVGDRVGGAWHAGHDGTCNACKKGHFQMCDNKTVNGIMRDGGYAEYCLFNSEATIPIPEHVDAAKYAPILCAGVTVFNSMRRLHVEPGSLVAVQGLGGLGHLAIQYARKFGYRVVALSRDASKEKFARSLGAHEYLDASKGDQGEALAKLGGAALVVATAPSKDAIEPLMKGMGILGKLLVLSVSGEIPVDTIAMIQNGLSVHGWPSGTPKDAEEAVRFTELAEIDCMVQTFPLDKCNDAFKAMMDGSVRFRAVVTM